MRKIKYKCRQFTHRTLYIHMLISLIVIKDYIDEDDVNERILKIIEMVIFTSICF